MFIQTENFGSSNEFRCRKHNENYNYRTHLHQFAELMFVLDGEIEVTVDNRVETAKAGQFILIFPLQSHSFRTPEFSRVWNCVFTQSLVSDFFILYDGRVGEHAVFDGSEHSRECFTRLLVDGGDMRLFSVKSCLYAALADFVSQTVPTARTSDSRLSSKFIGWLRENAASPVTLADAAKSLGYAENYLSHQIAKLFGMNFRNLLGCLRAEKAKELLSTTDKTILQIAYECGFGSERSFSRSFGRATGETPSTYRHCTADRIAWMHDNPSFCVDVKKDGS